MTIDKLDDVFKDTFNTILELSQKKNSEYSSTVDVFSNFNKASTGLSFHNKKEMVAWEYLTKHLQSIKDIISSDKYVSEEVLNEKFNDAITYLLLIKAMMYEKMKYSNGVNGDTITPISQLKYFYVEQ